MRDLPLPEPCILICVGIPWINAKQYVYLDRMRFLQLGILAFALEHCMPGIVPEHAHQLRL